LLATSPDDVGTGLRTAAALWRFWQRRGHLREGRDRLVRLLSLPGGERRDAPRVLALRALGSIEYWLGDYGSMQPRYEEAVTIAEELGDRGLLARALYDLSYVPMVTGRPEEQGPTLERALEVAAPDDLAIQADIVSALGWYATVTGDMPGAIERLDRSVELYRRIGERLALAEALILLAGIHFLLGDQETTLGYLNEAAEIAAGSANPKIVAEVLVAQALFAVRVDAFDRAAQLVGAADRLGRDFDVHFPEIATDLFGHPEVAAREALGDEKFEQARAEGFALDLRGMIELLEEPLPT
jgi:tetratricopeptide (TPR) repeat protein